MDNNGSKLSDKSELPTELRLENTMDTSGMWFAAAVLFAVLAAGIIIYRAANDDRSPCLWHKFGVGFDEWSASHFRYERVSNVG